MTKSRASWKGPLIKNNILKKIKLKKTSIKVFSRSSSITPICVGLRFLIHNGKTFSPLVVTSEMIGCKFGEFSSTRKRFKFKK